MSERGPAHLIDVFKDELSATLGQLGCASVSDLRAVTVRHNNAYALDDLTHRHHANELVQTAGFEVTEQVVELTGLILSVGSTNARTYATCRPNSLVVRIAERQRNIRIQAGAVHQFDNDPGRRLRHFGSRFRFDQQDVARCGSAIRSSQKSSSVAS